MTKSKVVKITFLLNDSSPVSDEISICEIFLLFNLLSVSRKYEGMFIISAIKHVSKIVCGYWFYILYNSLFRSSIKLISTSRNIDPTSRLIAFIWFVGHITLIRNQSWNCIQVKRSKTSKTLFRCNISPTASNSN